MDSTLFKLSFYGKSAIIPLILFREQKMNELQLVLPKKEHEEMAKEMVAEFNKYNEMIPGGGGIDEFVDYQEWLAYQRLHHSTETVPKGRVPSTVYFLCDNEETTLVGIIDIRYELNDFLLKEGGHIGYAIRPHERREGYGSYLLELGLEKCLELGIEEVLITCDHDNLASIKIVENHLGELEDKVVLDDGNTLCRYWVRQEKRLRKSM